MVGVFFCPNCCKVANCSILRNGQTQQPSVVLCAQLLCSLLDRKLWASRCHIRRGIRRIPRALSALAKISLSQCISRHCTKNTLHKTRVTVMSPIHRRKSGTPAKADQAGGVSRDVFPSYAVRQKFIGYPGSYTKNIVQCSC